MSTTPITTTTTFPHADPHLSPCKRSSSCVHDTVSDKTEKRRKTDLEVERGGCEEGFEDGVSGVLLLEQRMRDAFPYSKYGNGRDAYSHNRVRRYLDELQALILRHAYRFLTPAAWDKSLNYLTQTLPLVLRLPEFDDPEHSAYKHELVHKISVVWTRTVKMIPHHACVPRHAPLFEACQRSLEEAVVIRPSMFDSVYTAFQERVRWEKEEAA